MVNRADNKLLKRHAREFARLVGADVAGALNLTPTQGTREIAARQAAMRAGLGLGMSISAVARCFATDRYSVRAADGRYRSDGAWRLRRRGLL